MKTFKKAVAVITMTMVMGGSIFPLQAEASSVTATVVTNKGKVTTTKSGKTETGATTKAKTSTVDAYILSRSKDKASFISTEGVKFTMPVVLDASNKGDLVQVTYQGTLTKPRKIQIKNKTKAKTLVGTINQELSAMSVLHIDAGGKTYSFVKDYCQMNVSGSTKSKVKVYYIDQSVILVEAAK